MEPVEIDIRMKQNVTEEGKKATGAMGEMDDAAKKAQQQVTAMLEEQKKLIAEIEKNLAKTESSLSKAGSSMQSDVDKLTQASDILKSSLEEAKNKSAEVEAVLTSGTAGTSEYASAMDQLTEAGADLGDILGKSNQLQDISNELTQLGKGNVEALTRSKSLLARANQWVAATFNLSEKAAARFGAVISFGLTIAISALIRLFQKWRENQEKVNEANKEISRRAGEQISVLSRLSAQWKDLGDNLEAKKRFLVENGGEIKKLTNKTLDLVDADSLFVKNTGKFIEALILRSRAEQNFEKIKPKTDRLAEIENEIQTKSPKYKQARAGYDKDGRAIFRPTDIINPAWVKLQVEKKKLLTETEGVIQQAVKLSNEEKQLLKNLGLGAEEISAGSIARVKQHINELEKQYELADNYIDRHDIAQKITAQKNLLKSMSYDGSEKTGGSGSANRTSAADKKEYDVVSAVSDQLLELRKKTAALEIDLMQDGLEKKLAQIEAEGQAELDKVKENRQKILDEYNKTYGTDIKDISLIPGMSAETLKSISEEEQKIVLTTFAKKAKATSDSQKEITELARKYAEERLRIEYDYADDIARLEAAGQTEAANAAKAERDKWISDATAEMITSTDIYKTATDEKLQISAEATEKLIEHIKKRIEAEAAAGKLSKEKAKELLDELEKTGVSRAGKTGQNNPFTGLIKGLEAYRKAKADLKNTDADADPVKFAELENAANSALSSTAAAAGASLMGIEQILGSVVDGLDQLGMLTEEEKQTANEVMGMVGGAANLAMGIASGNPIQIIQGSIDLLVNGLKLFDKKSKDIEKAQKKHLQNVSDLERAYTKLQRAVDKALGTDVYGAQKALIENNKKQIAEYEAWIAQERKKKKKKQDEEAIKDKQDQIQALKNSTEDTLKAITESLAQTNARDLAGELASALVNAFRAGEDAAEAMGKVIDDVLRNAVVNSLKLKFLEIPLNDAVDYLGKAMDDGRLTDAEKKVFGSMVTAAGNDFNEALKAYEEIIGKELGDVGGRSAVSKGIAQASQDSIDELSGLITFMSVSLNDIKIVTGRQYEQSEASTLALRSILNLLDVIAENTGYLIHLREIKEDIGRMTRDGVYIKV